MRDPVTGRAFVLGQKQQIPTHILAASRLRMARNDKVVRETAGPSTWRFPRGGNHPALGMTRWSGALEVRDPVTGRAFVLGAKTADSYAHSHRFAAANGSE